MALEDAYMSRSRGFIEITRFTQEPTPSYKHPSLLLYIVTSSLPPANIQHGRHGRVRRHGHRRLWQGAEKEDGQSRLEHIRKDQKSKALNAFQRERAKTKIYAFPS